MTHPTSYGGTYQFQNGDPNAPPPLDYIKQQFDQAQGPDALEKVLALFQQTDPKPTYAAVREALAAAAANPEDSDAQHQARKQLERLIQWERRPRALKASEIDEQPPPALLTAAGQEGPLLVSGMVVTLSGAGGTGKSHLALQIALQFAAANEELSSPDDLWMTAAGPALICTYEDATGQTRKILLQQADRLGCPGALERIYVHNLAGLPLFGPPEGSSYNTRPVHLIGWDMLAEAAKEVKPRLVVIDPALSAYVGEANTAASVREFVVALAQLASQHNAAVLLVAHSTKQARADGDPFDPGQVSGSAAWQDAARAGLVLTRNDHDRWTLAISKANYGPSFLLAELKKDGRAFRAVDSPAWKTKNGQPTTNESDDYSDI